MNRILGRFSVAAIDQLPAKKMPAIAVEHDSKESFFSKMLSLLSPEHRRSTLILWSAFFMSLCTLYFLMSWVPKIMINAGYSTDVANYAFSAFNFGGVLGIFVLGAMATRMRLSSLICTFLLLAAAGMVVFAVMPAQQTLLMVLIFFIGMLLQGGFTGLYAAAAKIYPTEIRSTGVGWAIGLGRSGAVIGPALAGFVIAAGIGLTANFIIFAVPLVASGLLALWCGFASNPPSANSQRGKESSFAGGERPR